MEGVQYFDTFLYLGTLLLLVQTCELRTIPDRIDTCALSDADMVISMQGYLPTLCHPLTCPFPKIRIWRIQHGFRIVVGRYDAHQWLDMVFIKDNFYSAPLLPVHHWTRIVKAYELLYFHI